MAVSKSPDSNRFSLDRLAILLPKFLGDIPKSPKAGKTCTEVFTSETRTRCQSDWSWPSFKTVKMGLWMSMVRMVQNVPKLCKSWILNGESVVKRIMQSADCRTRIKRDCRRPVQVASPSKMVSI